MNDPVESKQYPGYYEIPGYSRYVISKEGEAIKKSNGVKLSPATNKDGYVSFAMKKDNREGYITSPMRHRLIALVFIPETRDISQLHVNHLNGHPGDDRIENLEWCTTRENTYHAGMLGISPKCLPILVKDVYTGEVETYPSYIVYANQVGLSKDAIAYRLTHNQRVYPEGKIYKLLHSTEPWYEPKKLEAELANYGTSKTLLARDIETGEITEFEKIQDFTDFIGTVPSMITSQLKRKHHPVIAGKWQVKLKRDPREWRPLKSLIEEISYTNSTKAVLVFDSWQMKYIPYPSTIDAAEATGVSITCLNNWLHEEYRIRPNGYGYEYLQK